MVYCPLNALNMTYHFLNTTRYLAAKLRHGLFVPEERKIREGQTPTIAGYRLRQPFVNDRGELTGRGGIYQNKSGKKVVVKTLARKGHDIQWEYLANEASMLKLLEKLTRRFPRGRISPRLIRAIERPSDLVIETELVRGRSIAKVPDAARARLLATVLDKLRTVSSRLSTKDRNMLAKRTTFHYTASFLSHLVHVIATNPRRISLYLSISRLFFRNVLALRVPIRDLSLVHRDLDPANIVVSRDRTTVVDWESCVLSDPLYDLADVSRLFFRQLSKSRHRSLVTAFVKTPNEARRFAALVAFSTLQTLSICGPASTYGRRAVAHFNMIQSEILPQYKKERKSLYERVNTIALNVIARANAILRLNAVFPTPALILCYHSVSDTRWRFSTPVREFARHITYLKRLFRVTSLSRLVRNGFPNGHVAITFDDGYADVYRNALPILKRHGLSATVFALGDRANVNRTEIDNQLPLMSNSQLNALTRCGWEIGFHTATHPDLRKLNGTELTREIVKGKQVLEKKIGTAIRYFAYPRGLYTDDVLSSVAKAGFQAAFTVDGGAANGNHPFFVDRIPLEGNATVQDLKALLSPPGLLVERLFLRILQMKERMTNFFSIPASVVS